MAGVALQVEYNMDIAQDLINRLNTTKDRTVAGIKGELIQDFLPIKDILQQVGPTVEQTKTAKTICDVIVAKYITADQRECIQSVKATDEVATHVFTALFNRVGADVMRDPMFRGFFGMVGALTGRENIVNFFLAQSIIPAVELTVELKEIYSDEIIQQIPASP